MSVEAFRAPEAYNSQVPRPAASHSQAAFPLISSSSWIPPKVLILGLREQKAKLAEHGTRSSGSTLALNGSDYGTELKAMTDSVNFTISEAAKIICDFIVEYSDNEDVCKPIKKADKAVFLFTEKNGEVVGLPIPASAKTMSDASMDMELTSAYWNSLAARTAADS
ncbi:hypothetical protein QTP88_010549 [Uroleucon formosanum]